MKSEIRERFERLEAELNEVRIAGIKRRNVDYWQGHADGRAGIMPCDNPPPPSRFKVGEWVRAKSGEHVGRVVSTNFDGTRPQVLSANGYRNTWDAADLEPWTPRDGEWVMWHATNCTWTDPITGNSKIQMFSGPYQYDSGIVNKMRGNSGTFIPAPLGPASKDWFA